MLETGFERDRGCNDRLGELFILLSRCKANYRIENDFFGPKQF